MKFSINVILNSHVPSDSYAHTILHDLDNPEMLKTRLNRRLQKLARWGDKPVDDRQPAEMRMQLRSNVVTQFKSSYGGMINMPTTGSQSIYNQVAAISTKIQSYSAAPIPISNVTHSAMTGNTVAPSSSSSSSSQPSERDSQQKVTNMFNTEGLSVSNSLPATQLSVQKANLPSFATVQNQIESSTVTPIFAASNSMGSSSTVGVLGSAGLSMGGITTDL